MTVSKWTAPSLAWWLPYISWQKNAEISELHVAAMFVWSPLTTLRAVRKFIVALCRLCPVARFTFSTPLPSLEASSVGNEWTLRLYEFWYDMIYDIIWYDIWYDMIWYDMMWYDMIYATIWYDELWYDIWYDMMWCDIYDIWYGMMIWYDMIWWYDMMWYDIWYDMMWYDIWLMYDMIWWDMIYDMT